MVGVPDGVRKLLIAYDVAGYSGRLTWQQTAIQERLVRVLGFAFREGRVNDYELQEQGDGGLGLLPTGEGVDEPRVIAGLIAGLEEGLAQINDGLVTEARIRLRVGLDEGTVYRADHGFTGEAVTRVCRLRDSGAVRETLQASGSDLVVVLSDHLYRDAVAGGRARGPAFSAISVTAKEYSGTGWIYLPEGTHSSPPVPRSAPAAVPEEQHSDDQERSRISPPAQASSLAKALRTDPRTW